MKARARGVDRLAACTCSCCGTAGAISPAIPDDWSGWVAIGMNSDLNTGEDWRMGGPGPRAAAWAATCEWEPEREDMLETCHSVEGVQVENPYPWNWFGVVGELGLVASHMFNIGFGCMERKAGHAGPNAGGAANTADSVVPAK